MDANFFGPAPDPAANPSDYAKALAMAQALMKQGSASPQGSSAGGQYVAPSPLSYLNQVASGAASGMQMNRLAEAQRASTILNGGTVAPRQPGLMGGFRGMFGGG